MHFIISAAFTGGGGEGGRVRGSGLYPGEPAGICTKNKIKIALR